MLKERLLESKVPNKARYALGLLKDPTTYMYAFFKDKEGGPMKLYAYQDMIVNDPSRRVLFAAANQIGKSIALDCKALHFALTNPGKTVLMVSKTLPQSKDLLREIRRLLNTSRVDYKTAVGDSDNKTEIYFKHFTNDGKELSQSRIICVPATEAALGYAVDLALVDELAFYDEGRYFYYQILQPRTYTTKGQIIVFSNPHGQQGIFWELWQNDQFSRYQFNFLDKPGNTLKEYEHLRGELTSDEFDSTVNAVFTSPAGGFLSLKERKLMQEERSNCVPGIITEPLYIFFDFAKVQDRTVRVVGVPVGEGEKIGVYVHEMCEYPQGTPYDQILLDLEQFISDVGARNVSLVGWDSTGVGKGVEDFFKRIESVGIRAEPVEFSLKNKSRIYTIFKLLAERNLRGDFGIKIPFVQECDKQLAQLRFKKSPNSNTMMIHHENERDRDDFPDALAGLCSLIIQPDTVPVSVTIVSDDDSGRDPLLQDDDEDGLGFVGW